MIGRRERGRFARLATGTAISFTVAMVSGLAPLACSSTDAEPSLTTLARLDSVFLDPARLPPLERVRLAKASRPAACLSASESFEVTAPAEARAMRLALALRPRGGRQEPVSGSLVASLALVSPGDAGRWGWEVEVAGEDRFWREYRIDLSQLPSGARLRFAVSGELRGYQACWASLAFEGLAPRLPSHPNIVLISLDTLGAAYLGAYGGEPDVSPRVDAFLERSFHFRRALAQFGNTLVSHSSLFSSLYPRSHRRFAPQRGGPPLDTLVEPLAAAGYQTVAFTEDAYVGSALGFDRGFDLYHDGDLRGDDAAAGDAAGTFARATAWLERDQRTNPFFLFVHTYEVHSPYLPKHDAALALANRLTPGDRRIFDAAVSNDALVKHNQGTALLADREMKRLRALYIAEILELDSLVGAFLDRLTSIGLEDNTLVVLTADHGEQFGEDGRVGHGASLHNHVLRVPLAFRWPGHVKPGNSDAVVQLIDVFPTMLELAGIAFPAAQGGGPRDGNSLAAALAGEEVSEAGRPAFAEERRKRLGCSERKQGLRCWVEHFAVQTRNFKLVRSRDGRYERFFDLRSDPLETRVVGAEHPQALGRLRALLKDYLMRDLEAARKSSARAVESEIDEELRQRLEALGYAS